MKRIFLLFTVVALISCNKESKKAEEFPEDSVIERKEDGSVVVDNDDQNLLGDEDYYNYNHETTILKWTAYKTPNKIAVTGTFNDISVDNFNKSEIAEDVLDGATFSINTKSLDTDDPSRDAKIVGLYFMNLTNTEITGKFGDLKNGKVPITINMNGKEVQKEFSYTFENRKIIITGKIDMISDFVSNSAFDILHDACSQLHEDKTWTDVSIEIITIL